LLLSDLLILAIPLCLNCRIWRRCLLCSLRLLLHSIARILFGHNPCGLIIRISIRQRSVFVLICWQSIHLLSRLHAQTNTELIYAARGCGFGFLPRLAGAASATANWNFWAFLYQKTFQSPSPLMAAPKASVIT
jgi:hypothetical protein